MFGKLKVALWTRHIDTILGVTLAMVLGLPPTPGGLRGQAVDEYQVKAAFLYNIAKFVEWPPGAFKSPSDPIVSCILGASPLEQALELGAGRKTIDNRGFVLRHISDARQASGCHILFVSSSERKRWRSVVAAIKSDGILTVGETEGFASEGGVVNFKLEGDRVRIQINVDAAGRERLRISSRLLNLAQIVND